MASAPPRTERSAIVQQQIERHLAQSDLESIKQLAETDKESFPKDFIAQCLKRFRRNYQDSDFLEFERLFLDAFTWFVEEFGPTSLGYFGLGKSMEDVIDLRGKLAVLRPIFREIMISTTDVFQNLSLVVAESLIESFGLEPCMHTAMGVYVSRSSGYNDDTRTPERWGKFKMMVEYLIYQTVTDEGEEKNEEEWTEGDDGKVLIGHALVLLFARGVVYDVTQCLLFAKAHQPNICVARNNFGRTLLVVVLIHRGRMYSVRNEFVRWIVQEDADACLQRDRDGRLPIHLALRMKDQDLFDLIFNAATSVANQKCPKTHLYPYQLAAVQYADSNTPDDEAPDWSDDEFSLDEEDSEGFDEEDSDVAKLPGPNLLLSRIYELLRQSPNLVGDGISPDCRMLSHPESIAIARDELELPRLRDRHFQIEREQGAKVHERKRKHRSSSTAT